MQNELATLIMNKMKWAFVFLTSRCPKISVVIINNKYPNIIIRQTTLISNKTVFVKLNFWIVFTLLWRGCCFFVSHHFLVFPPLFERQGRHGKGTCWNRCIVILKTSCYLVAFHLVLFQHKLFWKFPFYTLAVHLCNSTSSSSPVSCK